MDIYPTEEELALMDATHLDARWWLLHEAGEPVSQVDQALVRPKDSQPHNGNYHTPWFNKLSHMHDADHDYPWSIHGFGTLEGVLAAHKSMLERCKR